MFQLIARHLLHTLNIIVVESFTTPHHYCPMSVQPLPALTVTLREATFSLFNMVVDPIPKLRFVLCAIRDTNEHIGQLILLQLELISIPFE